MTAVDGETGVKRCQKIIIMNNEDVQCFLPAVFVVENTYQGDNDPLLRCASHVVEALFIKTQSHPESAFDSRRADVYIFPGSEREPD